MGNTMLSEGMTAGYYWLRIAELEWEVVRVFQGQGNTLCYFVAGNNRSFTVGEDDREEWGERIEKGKSLNQLEGGLERALYKRLGYMEISLSNALSDIKYLKDLRKYNRGIGESK